jgi:ketosteroid isomerase-like protein
MHIRWCGQFLVAVFVLALASIACQPPAQEVTGLSEEDVAAIRAVCEENEQAGLAGDWESFFSHFAEDAVVMWQNSPAVEGLQAIKGLNWVRAIEYENSIVQIDGRGDLAFVRGTYSLLLDYEGAVKDEGKFLDILRKQPDGSWLFAVWMMSSNLPLPEQSTEGDI